MSKCAENEVWGLSSTFTFCDNSPFATLFFHDQRRFMIGFHVSTWSKLLRTLYSFETFHRFNPLFLSKIYAFPQSTPLRHSMVCCARPPSTSAPIRFSADTVFPLWRSSFVSLTLSMCSVFLVWKRRPHIQYSGRHDRLLICEFLKSL